MDRQALSDVLGTASFVVWLFAQSPQLYENYRNKSCEGLSVIFLVQWMLGDATNLLGSILTNQLTFQIAVATYFCCIDCCILLQYYHYWKRDRRIARQKQRLARRYYKQSQTSYTTFPPSLAFEAAATETIQNELVLQQSQERSVSVQNRSPAFQTHAALPPTARRQLSSDSYWRTRTSSLNTRPHTPARAMTYDLDHNYRALGEAAKSVAELATETERRLAERQARRKWAWQMALRKLRKKKHTERENLPTKDQEEDDDENEIHAHLIASTSSLSSMNSDHDAQPFAAFGSASTPDIRTGTTTSSAVHAADSVPSSPVSRRGRGMTRMAGIVEAAAAAAAEEGGTSRTRQVAADTVSASPVRRVVPRPSVSRSSTRASLASLSRKPTGMVLLGMTALFAWTGKDAEKAEEAQQQHHRRHSLSRFSSNGIVFGANSAGNIIASDVRGTSLRFPHVHPASQWWLLEQHNTDGPTWVKMPDSPQSRPLPPPPPPPTWDRIVGRISAWSCTVLYMTSRLPQIWTNMQRRSVQGLSILLFIAAATGNLLYTLSILLNPRAQSPPVPPAEQRAYLMESLPFLLGSGGTLIFDAIIVVQWIAWRGKAPIDQLFDQDDEAGGRGKSTHTHAHTIASTAALPASSSASVLLPFVGPHQRNRSTLLSLPAHKASAQARWQSLERQPLLQ